MTGVFEQVSGRVEKKERFAHWFRASGWLAVGPLRVEIVEMKIELVFFFFLEVLEWCQLSSARSALAGDKVSLFAEPFEPLEGSV